MVEVTEMDPCIKLAVHAWGCQHDDLPTSPGHLTATAPAIYKRLRTVATTGTAALAFSTVATTITDP